MGHKNPTTGREAFTCTRCGDTLLVTGDLCGTCDRVEVLG